MENIKNKYQKEKASIFAKIISETLRKKYLMQAYKHLCNSDYNYQRKMLIYENIARGIRIDNSQKILLPRKNIGYDTIFSTYKNNLLDKSLEKLSIAYKMQAPVLINSKCLEQFSLTSFNTNKHNPYAQNNINFNNAPVIVSNKPLKTPINQKVQLKNQFHSNFGTIYEEIQTQSVKSRSYKQPTKKRITILSPNPHKKV